MTRHVPHLVVPAPWEEEVLRLSVMQWRHLSKVLRMRPGQEVSYTDGLGTMGRGLLGNQVIERGDEEVVPRPSELTVAVAPPENKDRQRYLVEKLAEIGVARLIWLDTKHGKERIASASKVFSWVLAAVEQSRGAYLMDVSEDVRRLQDLEGRVVICHPGGTHRPGPADIVAIGPEGGFAPDEIPSDARLWDLGPTVLRIETAAVVAAISMRT